MRARVWLMIVLALAITACGQSTEPQVVSDVQIDLAVEPSPPAAGEATLVVTLTETDGTPIDGATIQVHGDMDHEGMTPVDGEADNGTEGVYRVPFTWTMGGGWIVEVTAALPDGRGVASRTFELFVDAVAHESIIHQSEGEANNMQTHEDGAMDMGQQDTDEAMQDQEGATSDSQEQEH